MKTQEILTIIGLSCLGLCLLLCLLKMSMKDKKGQANCDKACGMLFFAAAVLIGVSQLLKETSEPYGECSPPPGNLPGDDTSGALIAGNNQLCADVLAKAKNDGFRSVTKGCNEEQLRTKGTMGDGSFPFPQSDPDPSLPAHCVMAGGMNVTGSPPGVGFCASTTGAGNCMISSK